MKSLAAIILGLLISVPVFSQTDEEVLAKEVRRYEDNFLMLRKIERAFTSTEHNPFADGIFIPKTKVGETGMELVIKDVSEARELLDVNTSAFTTSELDDLTEINNKVTQLNETLLYRALFVVFLDSKADELGFFRFRKKKNLREAAELVAEASINDLAEIIGDEDGEIREAIQGLQIKLLEY